MPTEATSLHHQEAAQNLPGLLELRATDIQSCILRLLYAGVAPLMSVQLTQAENMA